GYISGSVRTPFERYLSNPREHASMDWSGQRLYPRPDYLSSSRKRLAPQLLFKGGIPHSWGKKQAVAVDRHFFATLPHLDEVSREEAELAWLIYDLQRDAQSNRYHQTLMRTVYTRFKPTLDRITVAEPGEVSEFIGHIQTRLSEKLDGDDTTPPDAPSLQDIVGR
ncbi:MAG: NotI family restriction endonuclease, partial [Ktedonobacterales bacterium]